LILTLVIVPLFTRSRCVATTSLQWRRKRYGRYGGDVPICWNLGSWFSGKSLKFLPPDVTF